MLSVVYSATDPITVQASSWHADLDYSVYLPAQMAVFFSKWLRLFTFMPVVKEGYFLSSISPSLLFFLDLHRYI